MALMSDMMKIQENYRKKLRDEVNICEQHNDFIDAKSTTDALLALRILMEKCREQELPCGFNAFNPLMPKLFFMAETCWYSNILFQILYFFDA